MEAIQKVYLVGLGAVGSAYAAKMNEAEPDLVKVIVDQERYEAYRDQGDQGERAALPVYIYPSGAGLRESGSDSDCG